MRCVFVWWWTWGPAFCSFARVYRWTITTGKTGNGVKTMNQSILWLTRRQKSLPVFPMVAYSSHSDYLSRLAQTNGIWTLFFHQVGQVWSRRAVIVLTESPPRYLAFGHGFRASSFKNTRERLEDHSFGVGKRNKNETVWRDRSKLGPWSSNLDQTCPPGQREYFRKCLARKPGK